MVELTHKRCLRMQREGKEHLYSITKTGLGCVAKYEADTAEDLIKRIVGRGQIQAFERVLRHTILLRVRCKKCGTTNWDKSDKRIEIEYEPYDENIHPDLLIPFYHCTRCGTETTVITVQAPDPVEEVDNSNFVEERVSAEMALQDGWRP